MTNWQLVVHGGCGAMRLTADEEQAGLAGLNAALDAGEAILARGGDALDAVEAAFRLCRVQPGECVGVLAETRSRPINLALAEAALHRLPAVARPRRGP